MSMSASRNGEVANKGPDTSASQAPEPPRDFPPSTNSTCSVMKDIPGRSEEQTSEIQSLMRISYAVFCLKKKKKELHDTNVAIKEIRKKTNKIQEKNETKLMSVIN